MHFKMFIHGKAIQGKPFLLSVLFILILGNNLSAQDLYIIRNENPTEYIQRIEIDPPDKARAWDSCRAFATQLKYPGKVENDAIMDESLEKIAGQFGFYLYRQMAFLKQVDAAVFADLEIDFQQNQVVAAIRNIYVMDYARDRYGKFSPISSKRFTLEDLPKKRNNDTWRKHLNTIDNNIRLLLSNLNKSIEEIKAASLN